MTEDEWLRTLSLADRLRIAAVDLAFTGAPPVLAAACWQAAEAVSRLVDYRGSVHQPSRRTQRS